MLTSKHKLGVVVIGLNERDRLAHCLASLPPGVPTIYVDSRSTDGSLELAQSHGLMTIVVPAPVPLTASRARRIGFERLRREADVELVQFVDGDCTLTPGWLPHGIAALDGDPKLAACWGTSRELGSASLVERWMDWEWRHLDCYTGNVLIRAADLEAVGGFRGDLSAGEERELASRFHAAGKKLSKLDVPMAVHRLAPPTLNRWVGRTIRTGFSHAYAAAHGLRDERGKAFWTKERRSHWLWTIAWPLSPLLFARVYRRTRRDGGSPRESREFALACCLLKPLEVIGELRFILTRRRPREVFAPNPPGLGFKALLAEDRAQHGSWFSPGFWALAVHRLGARRVGMANRFRRLPFTALYRIARLAAAGLGLPRLPSDAAISRRTLVDKTGRLTAEPPRHARRRLDGSLPRVDVYTITWNEEALLPHFLRHYSFASHIVIYDNHSTDRTRRIAEAFPNVIVRPFGRADGCTEEELSRVRNECWKESRGQAHWTAVVDADEFLYHRRYPDLRHYLVGCEERGLTVAVPTGVQMVSDRFPQGELTTDVRNGVRCQRLGSFDKWCLFRPELIDTMNFSNGSHFADPRGEAWPDHDPDLLLLHYAHLGWDYVRGRWQRRRTRVKPRVKGDLFQYQWDEAERLSYFQELASAAGPVLDRRHDLT